MTFAFCVDGLGSVVCFPVYSHPARVFQPLADRNSSDCPFASTWAISCRHTSGCLQCPHTLGGACGASRDGPILACAVDGMKGVNTSQRPGIRWAGGQPDGQQPHRGVHRERERHPRGRPHRHHRALRFHVVLRRPLLHAHPLCAPGTPFIPLSRSSSRPSSVRLPAPSLPPELNQRTQPYMPFMPMKIGLMSVR